MVEVWKIKNYVIRYEDWDSYNCETKEEAIEKFKQDHPEAEILEVQ